MEFHRVGFLGFNVTQVCEMCKARPSYRESGAC